MDLPVSPSTQLLESQEEVITNFNHSPPLEPYLHAPASFHVVQGLGIQETRTSTHENSHT